MHVEEKERKKEKKEKEKNEPPNLVDSEVHLQATEEGCTKGDKE